MVVYQRDSSDIVTVKLIKNQQIPKIYEPFIFLCVQWSTELNGRLFSNRNKLFMQHPFHSPFVCLRNISPNISKSDIIALYKQTPTSCFVFNTYKWHQQLIKSNQIAFRRYNKIICSEMLIKSILLSIICAVSLKSFVSCALFDHDYSLSTKLSNCEMVWSVSLLHKRLLNR